MEIVLILVSKRETIFVLHLKKTRFAAPECTSLLLNVVSYRKVFQILILVTYVFDISFLRVQETYFDKIICTTTFVTYFDKINFCNTFGKCGRAKIKVSLISSFNLKATRKSFQQLLVCTDKKIALIILPMFIGPISNLYCLYVLFFLDELRKFTISDFSKRTHFG